MLQEYLGLSMCISQKGRGSFYASLCLMIIKAKPRLGNELRVDRDSCHHTHGGQAAVR